MKAPQITSITLDQQEYSPGQLITATVHYEAGTSPDTQILTGTATDDITGQTGTIQVTFSVEKPDPATVTITDSGSRVWGKISDDGFTAIFTAIA